MGTLNLVHIQIPDEGVLLETGVIERPTVSVLGSFSSEDLGNSFAVAQSIVAQKLITEDATRDWTIHQIGSSLSLPLDVLEIRRTLRFELVNLLPVPSADVPIIDILEFKERRADELDRLHQCLEAAYIEALKSPDPDFASRNVISDLRQSISDIEKASTKRWKKSSKFDLSVELNIERLAAGAVFDYFTTGFTIPIGTIAGVVSAIKLKAGLSLTFEPAKDHLKLSFLSRAHDEGIIKRG